jgi:hypothetical protein
MHGCVARLCPQAILPLKAVIEKPDSKSGDWKNLRFPAQRIGGVPQGIVTRGEVGARYRATDAVHILP